MQKIKKVKITEGKLGNLEANRIPPVGQMRHWAQISGKWKC